MTRLMPPLLAPRLSKQLAAALDRIERVDVFGNHYGDNQERHDSPGAADNTGDDLAHDLELLLNDRQDDPNRC
jgi:hypothetical protein